MGLFGWLVVGIAIIGLALVALEVAVIGGAVYLVAAGIRWTWGRTGWPMPTLMVVLWTIPALLGGVIVTELLWYWLGAPGVALAVIADAWLLYGLYRWWKWSDARRAIA